MRKTQTRFDTTKISNPLLAVQSEPETKGLVEQFSYINKDDKVLVSVYKNDKGLMVSFHECDLSHYSAKSSSKQFNGLLLNVYLFGSLKRESDSFIGERVAGSGNIARPWTKNTELASSTKHILSLNVVTLINDFKLSQYGEHTDMILQALLDRYAVDNTQFEMSDMSMAYCYALYKLYREHHMNYDEELIIDLVSGLLLDIFF